MTEPTKAEVENYYDARVEAKLRDFTHFNPRIEAAIETIAEWAPANPRRVLEIGCGIGATSWRMARAWPRAEVIGYDISPVSIDVARRCFKLPNLSYHIAQNEQGAPEGTFDLIVMMDVYEHVHRQDRTKLHGAIRSMLTDESRCVFSIPTPLLQQTMRISSPEDLQPVDEEIAIEDVVRLAEETDTHVLYFRELGIWQYGDYAHFVLGRYALLKAVALRECRPERFLGFKHRMRRLLEHGALPEVARDYLGTDLLRLRPRRPTRRFHVSPRERRRHAASWSRQT
jgi:SAM-dependent methyltransferase